MPDAAALRQQLAQKVLAFLPAPSPPAHALAVPVADHGAALSLLSPERMNTPTFAGNFILKLPRFLNKKQQDSYWGAATILGLDGLHGLASTFLAWPGLHGLASTT